jgi:hypothetical protein
MKVICYLSFQEEHLPHLIVLPQDAGNHKHISEAKVLGVHNLMFLNT